MRITATNEPATGPATDASSDGVCDGLSIVKLNGMRYSNSRIFQGNCTFIHKIRLQWQPYIRYFWWLNQFSNALLTECKIRHIYLLSYL